MPRCSGASNIHTTVAYFDPTYFTELRDLSSDVHKIPGSGIT